ncbi:MAG: NADH-quinone oxidoreductase subunit A [Elusimicrobia bacterium]|nr:NADH-quinone oxidoreductase subunit A [Elusimicrobiota bacterium]
METAALIIVFLFACAIAVSMIAASYLFGPKIKNAVKNSPFECGMPPAQKPALYFSNNFYKTALLLIIFDVEAVLIYPWAAAFKNLSDTAFYCGIFFIAALTAALFYAVKRGILEWD